MSRLSISKPLMKQMGWPRESGRFFSFRSADQGRCQGNRSWCRTLTTNMFHIFFTTAQAQRP
jgi:hypothetical protein